MGDTLDALAAAIYVAAVRPDTIWWDDLGPEMQDVWRSAAWAALRWIEDDQRARDRRVREDANRSPRTMPPG